MAIFTSKALYTPIRKIENAVLVAEDGVVVDVSSRDSVNATSNRLATDFGDCILVPGFFDVHIHGGAGCDVMRGGESDLEKLEAFLARHGVTSYFPTTVTASLEVTLSALERLGNRIERKTNAGGAQPLGIHLEGPFLSHAKRGVHPPDDLLPPKVAAFEKLWQAASGHVRMLTIAPELDGAEELIAEAARRGVCVSIGHSDANSEQARRGIGAGARHATHTFNAMRPLDHRDPGILGEVLTNDGLSADVICDGIHVAPNIVDLLFRAKGVEKLVLITDAISATGMPDGRYQLGELEVEVKNGRCVYGSTLAGSVLTMDRAVRNLMQFANVDLTQAVRAASMNPAALARESKRGVIEPGARADFLALTADGQVRATVINGVVVQ